MASETIVHIILAGIVALFLALFQYFYKNEKSRLNLSLLFSFLRFVTYFSILLLLINPKFNQEIFSIEKPNLVVAVDNSSSIKYLNQDSNVRSLVDDIKNSKLLNEKFNVEFYTFGSDFTSSDTLTFNERQTNIDKVFGQLTQIHKNTISPTLLISDGNQTYGNDYEFEALAFKQPIYSVILGDTIVYKDLKIEQLNINKYAYLKNNFPVEAILVYNGNSKASSKFVVTKEGSGVVYSQDLTFTKQNNSKVLNFTLPALNVGVSTYKASLLPIDGEKNKINNIKNFAIEVIDQKTKIAVVSDFPHPDLGALKKSIESNEQQTVSILKPNELINQINDFQLVVLYQPNNKFSSLFSVLAKENQNKFVVVGSKTDLNFLNRINKSYQIEITNQSEDYQAVLNQNYIPFVVDDIDFESFPPLQSFYGSVNFKVPFETILNKSVRGISTDQPLLSTFELDNKREAVLFGENIWQWRAQSYLNSKSFNDFDDFMGKIIQYLRSNKKRERLELDYETFYNGDADIVFKAQFFDKTFQFDSRASVSIKLKNKATGDQKILPLILKNNSYEVDLSYLPAADYNFTVTVLNENISKSGSFKILDYNVEQQFLNANVSKLKNVASKSQGKSYFVSDTKNLINDLLNDSRHVSIQKSNRNSLPLIDWKYLLGIIALSLSAEWFLRKYNGLI